MRKIFSILTFVILFLPMVQMCAGMRVAESIEVVEVETDEATTNIQSEEYIENATIEEEVNGITTTAGKTTYGIVLSGYELITYSAIITFNMLNPREKSSVEITITGFLFLSFAVISILLIIFAFIKKRNKTFLILSIVNLIVILTFFVSYLTIGELNDIKYSFYLLVLNSIIIVISGILHQKKYVNPANLVNRVKKNNHYEKVLN